MLEQQGNFILSPWSAHTFLSMAMDSADERPGTELWKLLIWFRQIPKNAAYHRLTDTLNVIVRHYSTSFVGKSW